MNGSIDKNHKLRVLTPEDVVAIKKPSQAVISPDGRWAVFVRTMPVLEKEKSEYRGHIWLVPTDGGEMIQLTNGPNGDSDPQWSPDGKRIAFVSRRDGNEKGQIWIISVEGGEARQLTYTENGASNPRWSPEGKRIAFLMEEKDSKEREKHKKAKDDPVVVEKDDFKQTHLWIIDVETMYEEPELVFTLPEDSSDEEDNEERSKRDKSHRLTEGDFHVSDPQWSPDGRCIAFISAPSPKADHVIFRGTIHIIDVEKKEIRKLTSHDGGESLPRWSKDGEYLAFVYQTDESNYNQKDIYTIPWEGGTPTNLTRDFDHNEVAPVWSPDGDVIYFETVHRVRRHIYAIPKDGGQVRQITHGDCATGAMSIADDGDTYLCYRETPTAPMDLCIGSIRTGELRQITELNPRIADFALAETRVIQWQSHDGFEIEGLLRLPVGYQEGESYALVLDPHGGPHGANVLQFDPAWHFLSGEGFAVLAPNFRGSDGYGRRFARANYHDWGMGDYQDVMAGVDHLISQGIADPHRLAVRGWSYGGYMTAWIVTQTDRFKAACMGAGLSNLVSMYAQHDIPSFMRIYFKDSSPYQQLEPYHRHSPVSYVHQASTPTLILHGAEDKRVPVPQAAEFYAGLKEMGIDTEFVKYPREGHSIQEPRHILDLLKRQLEWFRKHMPDA